MTKRRAPLGTQQRTSERCIESGIWQVYGGATTAPISVTNVMPPYAGRAVTWVLIAYA